MLPMVVLALSACATPGSEDGAKRANTSVYRTHRENTLQATWSGRPYHTLVETFGSPSVIMALPNHRSAKTSIVVYSKVDKVSNCIDAFTIVTNEGGGDSTVADYFCR